MKILSAAAPTRANLVAITAAALAVAVLSNPFPAVAQSVQTYAAVSAGALSHTSNGPNTAISDTGFIALNDGEGGLGQASAVVNLPDGSLSASSHGCSAPPIGTFTGYGNGHTSTQFNAVYDLTSASVPLGTLVDVEVHIAASLAKKFKFELKSFNDDINGSATLKFSFSSQNTQLAMRQGNYSWQNGTTIVGANGLLADGAAPDVFTLFGIPVGKDLTLDTLLNTDATGRSGFGQEMDASIQVGANFGLRSLTPNVTLTSRPSGGNAPDTDTVNPTHLAATVPAFPLPTGASNTPEPGTLTLLGTAVLPFCFAAIRRRRLHKKA